MLRKYAVVVVATLFVVPAGTTLGKDKASPMDVEEVFNLVAPKTIFVSSTDHMGDLGGLGGG